MRVYTRIVMDMTKDDIPVIEADPIDYEGPVALCGGGGGGGGKSAPAQSSTPAVQAAPPAPVAATAKDSTAATAKAVQDQKDAAANSKGIGSTILTSATGADAVGGQRTVLGGSMQDQSQMKKTTLG